jgi:hypothetical protein
MDPTVVASSLTETVDCESIVSGDKQTIKMSIVDVGTVNKTQTVTNLEVTEDCLKAWCDGSHWTVQDFEPLTTVYQREHNALKNHSERLTIFITHFDECQTDLQMHHHGNDIPTIVTYLEELLTLRDKEHEQMMTLREEEYQNQLDQILHKVEVLEQIIDILGDANNNQRASHVNATLLLLLAAH